MNPLLRTLIADGVESVVRGLVTHFDIRPSRTGAVADDDLRILHNALRNKGYVVPRFNLGAYKDMLMGAVKSVDVARQFNRQTRGTGTPSDLPLFPGAAAVPSSYTYLTVFTVRYPDGTTADAVVEVRSSSPLSGRSLRAQATTLMENRLSIISFPGDRGAGGVVVDYKVVSAYRGVMP